MDTTLDIKCTHGTRISIRHDEEGRQGARKGPELRSHTIKMTPHTTTHGTQLKIPLERVSRTILRKKRLVHGPWAGAGVCSWLDLSTRLKPPLAVAGP